MSTSCDPRMGAEVRIVGSKKYCKNDGAWINTSKGDAGFTPLKIHLLIKLGSKTAATCLMRKNVVVCRLGVPTSFVEAVLNQHPTIESKMDKLAMLLAHCGINDNQHIPTVLHIFAAKLETASAKLACDTEATYYKTNYDPHAPSNMDV